MPECDALLTFLQYYEDSMPISFNMQFYNTIKVLPDLNALCTGETAGRKPPCVFHKVVAQWRPREPVGASPIYPHFSTYPMDHDGTQQCGPKKILLPSASPPRRESAPSNTHPK